MAWAASADDNPFADPSVAAARSAPAGNSNNTPSWLSGGAAVPPPPPPAAAPPPATATASTRAPDPARDSKASHMVILTRLINMGLCVLLSATAVLELIGLPNFQTLVLAVYLFAFACILCCFETHISFIASLAASNFGFLYNAKGRALFLLFVGILCFSFGSILGYISGIAMIADSIFNFFVILKYPEVQNQQRKDLESSSRDFVRNNQGAIARQGVAFAQNNPQQAAAAARTASTFV